MNNNNFPPRQQRRAQQGPNQFVPINVIMALIDQSKKRYALISQMIENEDRGFRQLDLESTTMAQLMMDQFGQADPQLHALGMGLQSAKRAGSVVRKHLEDQLEAEKFLCAQLMRWSRGQAPLEGSMPMPTGNAPPVTPPAQAQPAQLAQGPVPQQVQQQRAPQQMQAPQQSQQPPPSYFQQTPYGLDPNAPPPSQAQQQPQGIPQQQGGVPGHMFGPYPGMQSVPFQPFQAQPESLPVTQLPVTQVPFDPQNPAFMPPPIAQQQQYASPEAARVAIPGPPQPIVAVPPIVQYASPEAAKIAVDASHANNVPAVSVPQATNGQVIQKPIPS